MVGGGGRGRACKPSSGFERGVVPRRADLHYYFSNTSLPVVLKLTDDFSDETPFGSECRVCAARSTRVRGATPSVHSCPRPAHPTDFTQDDLNAGAAAVGGSNITVINGTQL